MKAVECLVVHDEVKTRILSLSVIWGKVPDLALVVARFIRTRIRQAIVEAKAIREPHRDCCASCLHYGTSRGEAGRDTANESPSKAPMSIVFRDDAVSPGGRTSERPSDRADRKATTQDTRDDARQSTTRDDARR